MVVGSWLHSLGTIVYQQYLHYSLLGKQTAHPQNTLDILLSIIIRTERLMKSII